MMKALFSAATGMDAQQTRIAVISNNIANVNTTGFKSSRTNFEDLIYDTKAAPGGETATGVNSPTGLQVGSGVRVSGTSPQFAPGTLEATGNTLDLAIEGDGFFTVTLPSGEVAYTRAGDLTMDAQGNLVTKTGFPISPSIKLNPTGQNRHVGVDGTITSTAAGQTASTTEGTLSLVTFPNPSALVAIGRNLYQETTSSGAPVTGKPGQQGVGQLQSGFLEGSNVNIAQELINMIMAQRSYEMNSKVIQTSDQMLSSMTQMR